MTVVDYWGARRQEPNCHWVTEVDDDRLPDGDVTVAALMSHRNHASTELRVFPVAPGGAQAHYGVTPDLATFAKVVAGGMPGGAVVGCGRL